eukprot:g5274.t1
MASVKGNKLRGGGSYKPKVWGHKNLALCRLTFDQGRGFVHRLRLTNVKEWLEWSKSGQRPSNVPSNPDQVYKGKGWVSYPDWMGYQYTRGDQSRGRGKGALAFEDARNVVHRLRLTSKKEWWEWSKSGQRPSNVPSSPDRVYKGKGWVSYPDWMGYQYTNGDRMRGRVKGTLAFEDARKIVHRLRLTSQKEWKEWSKSGQRPSNVPSCPDQVYNGKGWVSYPDWMGYRAKKVKGQMLPFHSARGIVRELQMTSNKEWQEWSKSGQRPSNVPSHPEEVYKGKGWVSWPDWMGYQFTNGDQSRGRGKGALAFEDARKIVRRLRLTSQKEWKEWSKSGQRPSNVPSCPDQVYNGKGWVSWPDWMGYQYTVGDQSRGRGKGALAFEDARQIVCRLRLTSTKEWEEWSKSGQRPSNVPSHPDQVYKGKGWVSYPDWMGYQYTKGDQNKKRKRKRGQQSESSQASSSSSSSSSFPPALDNCSICFEPLCPVTTEIGYLSCVHSFHVDCLNGHAIASSKPATTSRRGVLLNCPLCRKRTRWLPPPPPPP